MNPDEPLNLYTLGSSPLMMFYTPINYHTNKFISSQHYHHHTFVVVVVYIEPDLILIVKTVIPFSSSVMEVFFFLVYFEVPDKANSVNV